MGRPFRQYLNDEKVYACGNCRTHLASSSELVSKHFHSKSGRAYLFQTAWNVVGGAHEQRMMTTGRHVVCDIFCAECMSCVGWQYIFAFEESQKYKEGLCILERALVVDFEKTSRAAFRARRVSSLSSGSGGTGGGAQTGSTDVGVSHSSPAGGSDEYPLSSPEAMIGPITLFAADDSGSEDDDC